MVEDIVFYLFECCLCFEKYINVIIWLHWPLMAVKEALKCLLTEISHSWHDERRTSIVLISSESNSSYHRTPDMSEKRLVNGTQSLYFRALRDMCLQQWPVVPIAAKQWLPTMRLFIRLPTDASSQPYYLNFRNHYSKNITISLIMSIIL